MAAQLIEIFVTTPPAEEMAAVNRLAQTYGAAEVRLALDKFQKRSRRPMVGEEPGLYRAYRLAYARFGGERRFLSKPEFEDLSFEHARLFAEREFKALLRRGPGQRERELRRLLPRPPGLRSMRSACWDTCTLTHQPGRCWR